MEMSVTMAQVVESLYTVTQETLEAAHPPCLHGCLQGVVDKASEFGSGNSNISVEDKGNMFL
jgi:hypothetical protein